MHHDQHSFRDAGMVHMNEAINVIQHINRSNDKKHFIISIDLEKAFDEIQHNFMTKALYKLGMEGM
jgi:hypothetical protein